MEEQKPPVSSDGAYFAASGATRDPEVTPSWIEIAGIDPIEMAPGLEFRPVVGSRMLVNFVHFEPNTLAPRHEHDEEQICFVLEGELEFECDGETRVLRRGDVLHIPPGVPHAARTHDSTCLQVDVFAPPRQALLAHIRTSGEEHAES